MKRRHEKGTASGMYLSAVKCGPVVVPPLCALIVATWGWREIFYAFALPDVVLAVIPNHPSQSRFLNF